MSTTIIIGIGLILADRAAALAFGAESFRRTAGEGVANEPGVYGAFGS